MNDTETAHEIATAFKINQTVFDSENKEYVTISDGIEDDAGTIKASYLSTFNDNSERPARIQNVFDEKTTHFAFVGRV